MFPHAEVTLGPQSGCEIGRGFILEVVNGTALVVTIISTRLNVEDVQAYLGVGNLLSMTEFAAVIARDRSL